MNITLKIAYDGTSYQGWQKTKLGPSIEGALEKALSQLLSEKPILQAASRTDAGVHAAGQVVNFFLKKANLCLNKLLASLNSLLPKSISVIDIKIAPDDFHPTLDVHSKEYHYHVNNGHIQLPFNRHYSWHYFYPIDLNRMQKAALIILGTHDFKNFSNLRRMETYSCYTRTLYQLDIIKSPANHLKFIIRGDHFLYKMARNLVGTLLYVGRGMIDKKDIINLLNNLETPLKGVTAPALGLTLHSVYYKNDPFTHTIDCNL